MITTDEIMDTIMAYNRLVNHNNVIVNCIIPEDYEQLATSISKLIIEHNHKTKSRVTKKEKSSDNKVQS